MSASGQYRGSGTYKPSFSWTFFFFFFLEYSCFAMLFLYFFYEVNDKYCNIRKWFYSKSLVLATVYKYTSTLIMQFATSKELKLTPINIGGETINSH